MCVLYFWAGLIKLCKQRSNFSRHAWTSQKISIIETVTARNHYSTVVAKSLRPNRKIS